MVTAPAWLLDRRAGVWAGAVVALTVVGLAPPVPPLPARPWWVNAVVLLALLVCVVAMVSDAHTRWLTRLPVADLDGAAECGCQMGC